MRKIIKFFILATLIPLILMLCLFLIVAKSKIKFYDIHRYYPYNNLRIENSTDNPGIYQIREYNNKLFASDYHKIFLLNYEAFTKDSTYLQSDIPVIGWSLVGKTLYFAKANSLEIDTITGSAKAISVAKFQYPIRRMNILNDSMLIVKCLDSTLTDDDFYIYNIKTKSSKKIDSKFHKYHDGGFSNDGYFIQGKENIFYVKFNMGSISVINKTSGTVIHTIHTIDNNIQQPNVIRFSTNGYRLDPKNEITNLFAFINDSNIIICSNAYSRNEYYSGGFKNYYMFDMYSQSNMKYKGSIRIPKDYFRYGHLMDAIIFQKKLYLIYSKKIIVGSI